MSSIRRTGSIRKLKKHSKKSSKTRRSLKRSSKSSKKLYKKSSKKSSKKLNKKSSKKSSKKKIYKTRKMKGGFDLSEDDKTADAIIATIINTPNLISKCPIHKDTFGSLFETQTKCDLFFVNMLGKVQLMRLLMDKLPKEVATTISPKDISTIDSMITGIEVPPEVSAKYGTVLNTIINKLYSVDNLFRLASSNPEINKKLNEHKEHLELVTQNIKNILMVYFGVTKSSVEHKKLAKEFAVLVKFINALNSDSNNINVKQKESLQRMGMMRLINIVIQIINKNQSGGGIGDVLEVLGTVLFGPIAVAICLGLFFLCIPLSISAKN